MTCTSASWTFVWHNPTTVGRLSDVPVHDLIARPTNYKSVAPFTMPSDYSLLFFDPRADPFVMPALAKNASVHLHTTDVTVLLPVFYTSLASLFLAITSETVVIFPIGLSSGPLSLVLVLSQFRCGGTSGNVARHMTADLNPGFPPFIVTWKYPR